MSERDPNNQLSLIEEYLWLIHERDNALNILWEGKYQGKYRYQMTDDELNRFEHENKEIDDFYQSKIERIEKRLLFWENESPLSFKKKLSEKGLKISDLRRINPKIEIDGEWEDTIKYKVIDACPLTILEEGTVIPKKDKIPRRELQRFNIHNPKICSVCGVEFKPRRINQKYCNKKVCQKKGPQMKAE